MKDKKDRRIAYGAHCVWWDSIYNVGKSGNLPVCPYCGSVLLEMPSEKVWFDQVDEYEKQGHPGYRAFIEWVRGKCFKTYDDARKAYSLTTQED